MRKVIIMSGLPGSGKSYLALKMAQDFQGKGLCKVVSADDFFTVGGEYKFDPSKLGEAHQTCFRHFLRALDNLPREYVNSLVIVDNTNLSAWEISPYYLAAQAYGFEVEIIQVRAQWLTCLDQQKHKVPIKTMKRMLDTILDVPLLPWWKITTILNDRLTET